MRQSSSILLNKMHRIFNKQIISLVEYVKKYIVYMYVCILTLYTAISKNISVSDSQNKGKKQQKH